MLILLLIVATYSCGSVAAKKDSVDEDSVDEDEDNTRRVSVYGSPLQKCDRPEALRSSGVHDPQFGHTGFARDDFCGSMTEDEGTHYVCVELPRTMTPDGQLYSSFWTETGQAESPQQAVDFPKPGPWCICMWAFARMYQRRPEFANMLDCNGTNYWTVQMYDLSKLGECKVLGEICSRCSLHTQATRENIRLKCGLTEKFCPVQQGQETCAARGDCGGPPPETKTWWHTLLKSNPRELLLRVQRFLIQEVAERIR